MEDDLLAAMMDFDDPAPVQPHTVAPMSPAVAAPPRAPMTASSVASPTPPPAIAAAQPQQLQSLVGHYQKLAHMLRRARPEKEAEMAQLHGQFQAAMAASKTNEAAVQVLTGFKEAMRSLFGPELYEKAKQAVAQHQLARASGQPSPSPSPQLAAARRNALQQQAGVQQTTAQQQQQQAVAAQQRQAAAPSQPPARAASPYPPAAGPAGSVVAGQPAGTPAAAPAPGGSPSLAQQQQQQQMLAMQQQLMAQQHQQQLLAQQRAAAAAAAGAAAGTTKRSAEAGAIGAVGAALGGAPAATAAPGDMPAAKRPKTAAAGGAAGPAKPRKESDDVGVTVDNLIDYDQETNQLMEGLQRARAENKLRQHSQSNQQFLSEWRVGNEFYKQIQRTGGGLKVKGECFELVQLAFVAHMNQVIARALRNAQHRQDVARRSANVAVTSDPRRGVSQIERREKVKADAKAEAERAELLRLAGSKKADEETKERAQKAKAELVGKQQASLANAAVAATLGGKGKGKLSKWDKWAAAGPAAAAGGEEAGGAPAAGGKGKKGGGGKKGGKKGGAAPPDAGGATSEGEAVAGAKAPGAAAGAARGRGLTGAAAAAPGSDDASTVHLRDVVAVLERDPMYCHSPMLYRLLNTPRSAPAPAAAQ